MQEENHRFPVLFLFIWLCLASFILPVSAQEGYVSHEPITKIDLGVSELSLAVGESYTFHVTYEPEYTILRTLEWYVTDEQVISVDPLTSTITAMAEGEARIFAESIDEVSYAVCDVTVGTSSAKDVSGMKSGADYLGLSRRDLRKITAPTLVRYLDFIADSVLDDDNFGLLMDRPFDVLATVRSGSEQEESRLARAFGLDSDPLENLQSITLTGTAAQILSFVEDNKDLIEVFELGSEWVPDPIIEDPDQGELSSKAVQNRFNLQGQSDELSGITKAHELGLHGEGRIIAVIDTGFVSDHEQFLDNDGNTRFIKEVCFSKTTGLNHAACSAVGEGKKGSSYPDLGITTDSHGTHVAGIAAGRDGVAPEAMIIGITGASEKRWTCSAEELKSFQCSENSSQCCEYRFLTSNQANAYNYLIGLAKSGIKIDAVNMSYGGGKYETYCDSTEKARKNYFDKMIEAGILPVTAAGNDTYNDAVNAPGCISSAYTVAALSNHKSPYVARYSNFNKTNVDIAAPGTRIYSSVAEIVDRKTWQETCTKNCYGYKNGTSMATPMVSGAIALVRQLYPGLGPQDAGKILKDISSKSVSKRVDRYNKKITYKFPYSKPVLDLRNLTKWFSISDSNIKAQKGLVSVSFDDALFQESYQIKVYDVGKKEWMSGIMYTSSADKNIRTLDIRGNFQEGKLYRLEIKRQFENDPNSSAVAVKYFYPISVPKTLTAGIQNNGVSLNLYMSSNERNNHVTYRIFDWRTKELVRDLDADYESRAQTVSGLNNGQRYYVTAQFYRDIRDAKKSIRIYGMESQPVEFVPLNDSFVCRTGANAEGVLIECPEDPAADGIRVLYRFLDGTFTVQDGCTSQKGEFSCQVEDPSLLREAQQFIIMKYLNDEDGSLWNSSATVLTRLGKKILLPRPEKPLIYFENEKDTVTLSFADLGNADGIMILGQSSSGPEIVPYCRMNRRACVGSGKGRSYLVMRYKNDGGKVYYSPGILVVNNWGSD
ncbi:MAG: S8 family serine peptidase [Flexilinea sp.]|nr:S8 family serine peptidase [Flexilinea sp.]